MKMRNTNRGSILIVSLWILVLFVMLTVSLGYRSSIEAKLTLREKEYGIAEQAIYTGVNLAQYYLTQDQNPTVDSKHDEWYNSISFSEDVWESENLSVSIADIESKININVATRKQLTALFDAIDETDAHLYSDTEELIDQVIQWRGGTASDGVGDADDDVKGAPFVTLYELLFLDDFDDRDLATLNLYCTVYGNESGVKINPNTASPPVLKAVIFALPFDTRVKRKLYNELIDFREANDPRYSNGELVKVLESEERSAYLTEKHMSQYELHELLDIPLDVASVMTTVQFLNFCTVDSKMFEVSIEAKPNENGLSRSARIIIGPRLVTSQGVTSESGYTIYAWDDIDL